MRLAVKASVPDAIPNNAFIYLLAPADCGYPIGEADTGSFTSPMATVHQITPPLSFIPNLSAIAPISKALVKRINIPNQTLGLKGFSGITTLTTNFALQIQGKITTTTSGNFQMRLISDQGSFLQINGTTAVNADGAGAQNKTGTINLPVGAHPFNLKYYHLTNNAQFTWEWQPPGTPAFENVPAAQFSAQ